jgi:hypothetical protein
MLARLMRLQSSFCDPDRGKGKAGWLAYISEFVEEAKALGLVQKAIDRAEERGITVSAPGDSK